MEIEKNKNLLISTKQDEGYKEELWGHAFCRFKELYHKGIIYEGKDLGLFDIGFLRIDLVKSDFIYLFLFF